MRVEPLVQYEKRQPEQQVGAQMRLSVAPMMDWNGLLFFHRFLAVWCREGVVAVVPRAQRDGLVIAQLLPRVLAIPDGQQSLFGIQVFSHAEPRAPCPNGFRVLQDD